jgi:hypothetical protein
VQLQFSSRLKGWGLVYKRDRQSSPPCEENIIT